MDLDSSNDMADAFKYAIGAYKGKALYESKNISPVCRKGNCSAPVTYEYKQNSKNPANPKRSDYSCTTHKNQYTNDMWDEIEIGKDTRPILRHSIADTYNFRVPKPKNIGDLLVLEEIVPEIDITYCQIYRADSVTRSDGQRVTVHECEAHWVIVTWVSESGL